MRGDAGRKGDSAAAGDVVVADGVGVHDVRVDVGRRQAERFGKLHGDAGSRTTDVGRAEGQRHAAVCVDGRKRGTLQAAVEPKAGRDPSTYLAAELRLRQRCGVVLALLQEVDRLPHADAWEDRAIDSASSLLRGVLRTEFQRIEFQLLTEFVDDRLDGERSVGRAGSSIGVRARLVDADVVAINAAVRHVVAGEGTHRRHADRRTGKRPRIERHVSRCRRDFAVAVDAHLDLHI